MLSKSGYLGADTLTSTWEHFSEWEITHTRMLLCLTSKGLPRS